MQRLSKIEVTFILDHPCRELASFLSNFAYNDKFAKGQFNFYVCYREDSMSTDQFPKEVLSADNKLNVFAQFCIHGSTSALTSYVVDYLDFNQELDSLTFNVNRFLDIAYAASKAQSRINERFALAKRYNPEVTINITSVPMGMIRRDGTQRLSPGFELRVNSSDPVFVYFGSKDQTMLYASVLLSRAMGQDFQKVVFNRESTSRASDVRWLKTLFSIFEFDRDWDYWYTQIIRDERHFVDVAKSQLNYVLERLIRRGVKYELQAEVLKLCEVKTNNAAYSVNIDPHNIFYDDAFKVLL
jgi:hypothetical protein